MSATRAANLLLSTHGSFTKKREAGTVDLVLGDPFRFQPPLNESERERDVGRVGKGEPQEREYGGGGGRDIGNHPFDQPRVFAIGEKK